MNKPEFEIGEVVIYVNGDTYELGIIKRIVPKEYTRTIIGSDPIRTTIDYRYSYFVWYHTGDTTALTDEELLHKLVNRYAFKVIRLDPEGKERVDIYE